MSTLTQARLKELLTYNPATGIFTRKLGRGARAGAPVGCLCGSPTKGMYLRIMVDGRLYLAHRLAWLYMTGAWPDGLLDHHHRCGTDNRWSELRQATFSQNAANSSPRKTRLGLPRGVKPHGDRFRAWINSQRKRRYLGTFDTAEQASAAYLAEARAVHGAFCPA